MAQHALLSPSTAHRWLNCTPSARLEETLPDRGSEFADEGTLAHAWCAKGLKERLDWTTEDEDADIARLAQYQSGEMPGHVDTYVTAVWDSYQEALKATPDAKLLVETKLDMDRYAPGAFGTADAIIIADGVMEVVDFKYGKGVRVDAPGNPQMLMYALGAYQLFELDYNIETVRMAIVQPRLGNISRAEVSADGLLAWGEGTLRPRALVATRGGGEFKPGDWCRFCRARSVCKALADTCRKTYDGHAGKVITTEELARDILPILPLMKSWVSDMEAQALKLALAGERLAGYKLVEGRSLRRITDVAGAIAALRAQGYADADFLKDPELRGLTELEKAFGRKRLAELIGHCITKPAGKPTLAPVSDKRPEWNAAAADFAGFME